MKTHGSILEMLLMLALLATSSRSFSGEKAEPPPFVPGELLVKFRGGPAGDAARRIGSKFGHTVKHSFDHLGWQHIQLPPSLSV